MYDLIIIGGGPGGYLAAERAGEAGLKTLLVEKHAIGGVCLNEGCIPSKTLLNSGKIYDHARNGAKYGVTSENAKIDPAAVVSRKNKVVKTLVSGVSASLKAKKVTVKHGLGELARPVGRCRPVERPTVARWESADRSFHRLRTNGQ